MFWSNEDIIRFINEVRAHPELWDVDYCNYRDRNARKVAWAAVAAPFNITPDEAYKKFRNLRTYAKTEYKKCEVAGGKQMTWFAYEAISFVISTNKPDVAVDAENIKTEILDEDETFDSEETSDPLTVSPPTIQRKEANRSIPQTAEKKLKNAPQLIIDGTGRNETTLETSPQLIIDGTGRNPYSAFGEHVANKLNTYDRYTRAQVEFNISKILFDADMGKFNHAYIGQSSP